MKTDESKDEKEPSMDESKEGDSADNGGGKSKDGVHLSEEFQQEAHELISNATDKECSYLRTCLSDREQELRDAKKPKEMKGKPEVYDSETM